MPDTTNGVLAILNKKITDISGQREQIQSSQINSNSWLSPIQVKVHKDLKDLKTQVNNFTVMFSII